MKNKNTKPPARPSNVYALGGALLGPGDKSKAPTPPAPQARNLPPRASYESTIAQSEVAANVTVLRPGNANAATSKKDPLEEIDPNRCYSCEKHVGSDEWDTALDTSSKKEVFHDSGLYMCPHCGTLQHHGDLSDHVHFDGQNVVSIIPVERITEILNDLELDQMGETTRYNLGSSIINAIKIPLIQAVGYENALKIWPTDSDLIAELVRLN